MLKYSDEEIRAKAVELELIHDGEPVPARLRSRVVAALTTADASKDRQREDPTRLARSIVVEPEGRILIDGEPIPWLVARDSIDVVCNPKGDGTVRLTLLAERVEITAPKNESGNRA